MRKTVSHACYTGKFFLVQTDFFRNMWDIYVALYSPVLWSIIFWLHSDVFTVLWFFVNGCLSGYHHMFFFVLIALKVNYIVNTLSVSTSSLMAHLQVAVKEISHVFCVQGYVRYSFIFKRNETYCSRLFCLLLCCVSCFQTEEVLTFYMFVLIVFKMYQR